MKWLITLEKPFWHHTDLNKYTKGTFSPQQKNKTKKTKQGVQVQYSSGFFLLAENVVHNCLCSTIPYPWRARCDVLDLYTGRGWSGDRTEELVGGIYHTDLPS